LLLSRFMPFWPEFQIPLSGFHGMVDLQ